MTHAKGLAATPYAQLMAYGIHEQIAARDLMPALAWVEDHRTELTESTSSPSGQDYEFRLHRLQFLQLLTTQSTVRHPILG